MAPTLSASAARTNGSPSLRRISSVNCAVDNPALPAMLTPRTRYRGPRVTLKVMISSPARSWRVYGAAASR